MLPRGNVTRGKEKCINGVKLIWEVVKWMKEREGEWCVVFSNDREKIGI